MSERVWPMCPCGRHRMDGKLGESLDRELEHLKIMRQRYEDAYDKRIAQIRTILDEDEDEDEASA